MTEEEQGGGGNEPPEPPHTRLALADDQVKRWRDVIDSIRSRTDLTAKALAGLGSSILGAVGIAKFSDVFPLGDGAPDWVVWVTVGGFALVALALAGITVLLARVGAPVFTSPRLPEADGEEQELIKKTYDEVAGLNGAPSLQAYEARAHRLARIAERTTDVVLKERLEARATLINAEVQAAQGRAAADIVRKRSSEALTGGWAWFCYVVAVVGVIAFAVGSDYLEGKRSGETELAKAKIANAKECAAVEKAYEENGVTVKLAECPTTTPAAAGEATDEEDEPTPAEIRAAAISDLAAQNTACQAAAADTVSQDCARIEAAISSLSGG